MRTQGIPVKWLDGRAAQLQGARRAGPTPHCHLEQKPLGASRMQQAGEVGQEGTQMQQSQGGMGKGG